MSGGEGPRGRVMLSAVWLLLVCVAGGVAAETDTSFVPERDGPLFEARKEGTVEAVAQALAAGANINAASPSHGQTTLFNAIVFQQADIVDFLLDEGADPHVKQKMGFSALDGACFSGNGVAVPKLLALGLDPTLVSEEDGNAPLVRAAWGGSPGHAEALAAIFAARPDVDAATVFSAKSGLPLYSEAAKNAETQRVVANQILRTHCPDVGARADGAVDVHVERYDYDADAATTTFDITVVSEDGAVDTCAKTLATPNPNKDKPYAPKTPPPKVSVSVNRGEDDEAAKDEL